MHAHNNQALLDTITYAPGTSRIDAANNSLITAGLRARWQFKNKVLIDSVQGIPAVWSGTEHWQYDPVMQQYVASFHGGARPTATSG